MNFKQEKYGYDPLITMCKLALIKFYPPQTKLSFYENNIYIQVPSIVQGATRYYYGDSKKDLQQLLKPIIHCVNKYVLQNDDHFVKNIISLSIDGLKVIQVTYKDNKPIVLMIQSYIDLLVDSLKGHSKDYTNLNNIYADINNIHECDCLWSDLSVQVASDKLDQCVNIYESLSQDEDENKNQFENILYEFNLFIDAKQAKYEEFLQSN